MVVINVLQGKKGNIKAQDMVKDIYLLN